MAKAAEIKSGAAAAGTVIASPVPAVAETAEKAVQNAEKNGGNSGTKGVVNWGNEINTLPYYLL